jgi:hypothetical protein
MNDLAGASAVLEKAIQNFEDPGFSRDLSNDVLVRRLLLETWVRYTALAALLGDIKASDIESLYQMEEARGAGLATEIEALRKISNASLHTQEALESLSRLVREEPRNPAPPYEAWWYNQLNSELPERRALESGR